MGTVYDQRLLLECCKVIRERVVMDGRGVISFATYLPPGTGLATSEIVKTFPVKVIVSPQQAEVYLHEALKLLEDSNEIEVEPGDPVTVGGPGSKGKQYPDRYQFVVRPS